MHRWTASGEDDGKKLAEFFAERFPEEDKNGLKALLAAGTRLNGMAAKLSCKLNEGDIAELYTEDTPYARDTEVVYEDENLFIVNKEQNISCYTNKGEDAPALYEFAETHMREQGEYNVDTFSMPYICHGIDRRTGGLVMIAKDEIIYGLITCALRERRIRKFYKCIVAGVPEADNADLHDYVISKDKFARLTVAKKTMHGSVPVYLKYRLLQTDGKFSLLSVEMITDNISQICAQLSLHGLPVIGDNTYGNERLNSKLGVKLPALWANRLDFEVGVNNPLEYLDRTFIEAEHVGLPYFEFAETAEQIMDGSDPEPR